MKKFVKTSLIFLFIFTILFQNYVFASSTSVSDMFSQAKTWTEKGKQEAVTQKTMDSSTIAKASETVYNLLLIIAIIASVVVGAILAIQIMASGIEQKVKAKEALVPYAISCVVTFGAFAIWKICVVILGGIG